MLLRFVELLIANHLRRGICHRQNSKLSQEFAIICIRKTPDKRCGQDQKPKQPAHYVHHRKCQQVNGNGNDMVPLSKVPISCPIGYSLNVIKVQSVAFHSFSLR